MYFLMNKDRVAAAFKEEGGRFCLLRQYDRLPMGNFELNE